MKKRILPIVLVLLLACLTLSACFGLGSSSKSTTSTQLNYEVIIYDVENTKDYYTNDFVTSSGTYTKPKTDPTKEGYTFEGWYLDEAYQSAVG